MQRLVEDPDTQALPGATRATLEELRETLEAADIGRLVERMDSMIARLERGTDAGEAKLLRTLDELQSAINGLRTLSEDVRRNPSGALFGAPPPRSAMDRE
jgi:paraquat-inducible protein B